MLIGELSKRTGLSRNTIRFYEKQGLIKLGRRERRENNYKEYSELVLQRLLLLNKVKSYGFTLNESAGIISLLESNLASCDRISSLADKKIAAIEKKIEELTALKDLLRTSVANCVRRERAAADTTCSLFTLPVTPAPRHSAVS